MTTHRSIRTAAAALAVAGLIAGLGASAAGAAPAGPALKAPTVTAAHVLPTKTFANCTALKKVYKGGVAKSKSTVNKVNGVKRNGLRSTTKVSLSLYKANIKLDRDKDGWACES